jgi:hypothetical protein
MNRKPLLWLLALLVLSCAMVGCQKKADVVLTPEQEAEYTRMMNSVPKKTNKELEEENAKLKYEAEQRALDK